jgi:hypothetical protein
MISFTILGRGAKHEGVPIKNPLCKHCDDKGMVTAAKCSRSYCSIKAGGDTLKKAIFNHCVIGVIMSKFE